QRAGPQPRGDRPRRDARPRRRDRAAARRPAAGNPPPDDHAMNTVTIRHLFLVSACIAFATGCARREREGTEADAGTSTPQVEAPAPEAAAVRIDVSLTPAAEQRLAAAGEGVRVQC